MELDKKYKWLDGKDIEIGNIYYSIDIEYNNWWIFKPISDIDFWMKECICKYIRIDNRYCKNKSLRYHIKNYREYRLATQDEVDWFEYCELHGQYFEKEYALEYSEKIQLKQFIKENNLA